MDVAGGDAPCVATLLDATGAPAGLAVRGNTSKEVVATTATRTRPIAMSTHLLRLSPHLLPRLEPDGSNAGGASGRAGVDGMGLVVETGRGEEGRIACVMSWTNALQLG